jgi:hypothetical protein
LSNENPNEKKLDMLLGLNYPEQLDALKAEGDQFEDESTKDELKVDVTLRTQLGQSPMIMLLFPVKPNLSTKSNSDNLYSKVSLSFEIGLNGRVSVVDVTGLLDDESSSTNDATLDSQSSEKTLEQTLDLQSKVAHVLETSQDIGILVEWVLRWIRQQRAAEESGAGHA